MKKDIQVIRESIGRIVGMLTRQAIKVTQRGTRAYVAYHPRTGAIIQVNIPYIPDDASDDYIAAIQGFLDHEVGHVLFSDAKVLKEASALGKRVKNLANIVEDVFIERKMAQSFAGSGSNLESVRKFYLEKIARAKIMEALESGNTDAAKGYATVVAFRAWGGQAQAVDFLKDPKMAALVADLEAKLGPELIAEVGKCRNSRDCLELAKKLKAKMEAPKPKPPEPPKSEPKSPKTEPEEAGDSGAEPEDADPEDSDSDEGTVREEEDDSGKERDEPKASDSATEEGDGEAAEDEPPTPDGSIADALTVPEEPEPEPEPEPDDVDDPEGDTPADFDPGMTAGEDTGESDSEGEPSDEGPDDIPDEEGEPAGVGTEGDSDDGKSDADAGDAEGSSEEEGGGEPGSSTAEEPDDTFSSLFDEERDFDKEMGDKLTEDAKREIRDADYKVFSTDWDRIEPAPMSNSKASPATMVDMVSPMVGVMQKQLERAIAAQAKKMWTPGLRRGRISPGALFRAAVGDDRLFRQRFETRAKNTAVSLLGDCSGSMRWKDRIGMMGMAMYALAATLERIKVTYEAIGFTTVESPEMESAMRADGELSLYEYGREEALYMPVFKGFNERLGTEQISRIAHLTEKPRWINQNVDGECVQIAAHRLMQQRAERRILIVMSDGDPACPPGEGLDKHLKRVVETLPQRGIEVVGIGIQTDAVRHFYPKHVILNDLETLPTVTMSELTKLILA